MTAGPKGPGQDEISDEDRKIRHLRQMVDFTMVLIMQEDMDIEEASKHAGALRDFAARLFPGKEHVFDMVYGPGIKRLLIEKYSLS